MTLDVQPAGIPADRPDQERPADSRPAWERIAYAWLAREVDAGQPVHPATLADEVSVAPGFARDLVRVLRAHRQHDPQLAELRGRLVRDQLTDAYLTRELTGGQPLDPAALAAEVGTTSTVARGEPLDPATMAREVGVSEHYVRGTLTALRGGSLTRAQRIEQLWRLWEAKGGQRLAFADVARLLGVREGRVRQVLGPLRTAQRTTTDSADPAERPVVVEDDGRQAWLDQAACRDLDPERFFPESGEQTKAAEAKVICAGCQVRDQCLDLAVKAAGGLDQDHGVFGGTLPAERSRLRGNTFPAPSAYRQDRELAAQAHQLANQVGLRQAARRLGIHRDALKGAFTQWELPMPERRVGWQPSRFLTDRAEAERAFQLAEQLGSVNAAATELGTTWPSLRKAFQRHGLGMPTRNPEAVRQRAIAAARQRSGQPATPALDPVFVALNPGALPARERSPAELYEWVRRDEEYAILGANVVVELNSESHARQPTTRAWAIIRRAQRAHRHPNNRQGRGQRRQDDRATRSDRTSRSHQPQERGMVADAR